MATRASIAARGAVASQRIDRALAILSEREGIELPPPVTFPYRQPELRAAAEQERTAEFLEKLAGVAAPAEQVADTGPDNADADVGAEARKGDDGGEDVPDDDGPHFAGKPLSAFEGVADEDLEAQDGVGPATAKKIIRARKSAARKAARRAE